MSKKTIKKTNNSEEKTSQKSSTETIDEENEEIGEISEREGLISEEFDDKKIKEESEESSIKEEIEEDIEEIDEDNKEVEDEIEEIEENNHLNSKIEDFDASTSQDTPEVVANSESSKFFETPDTSDKSTDSDSENNGIEEISIESDKYKDIDLDDDDKFREMLKDFSDLEDGDLNMEELLEIQNAMEEVQEEEKENMENVVSEFSSGEIHAIFDPYEGWGIYEKIDPYSGWGIYGSDNEDIIEPFQPGVISEELEAKIQEELARKRKAKKLVTEDMFKKYCTGRRDKIWYFALWYLVFNVEDHQASKGALYEALKEETSKSAIDPTPEHKFYFGLGFILRLKIMEHKVIDFKGDILKLNVGVDLLIDLLREVGPPISNRPVITEKEKKNMYIDFLTDDFNDI